MAARIVAARIGGIGIVGYGRKRLNDDGRTDMSDSLYLQMYVLLGGNPPPAPFPVCDEDPTLDSLTCNAFSCRQLVCEMSNVGGRPLTI